MAEDAEPPVKPAQQRLAALDKREAWPPHE
jgi:hypothetical protein